jgi:PmbA protein
MLEIIKDTLLKLNVKEWKIEYEKISSNELFIIKKEIDMNRTKIITNYILTIYNDFEENGKKYKGSSSFKITPETEKEELEELINQNLYSSKFVYNEHYEILENNDDILYEEKNEEENSLNFLGEKIYDFIYSNDNYEYGFINSCEIFCDKIEHRIVNSKKTDVSSIKLKFLVDIIISWKEENTEEVEIHSELNFSELSEDYIKNNIKKLFEIAKNRAKAIFTPELKDMPVILNGEFIKSFFGYYYNKCNARMIYDNFSQSKENDFIQGENITGDKLNLKFDPYLKNSTYSSPYDKDGIMLKEVEIIKEGKIKKIFGNSRYCQYLEIPVTGESSNICVSSGKYSEEELKKEKYLEIISFSDFDMDVITGDFGGEIRSGYYYDGEILMPVTGGSISGNIKEVHEKMFFSKEMEQHNNFFGPKILKLYNVSITSAV